MVATIAHSQGRLRLGHGSLADQFPSEQHRPEKGQATQWGEGYLRGVEKGLEGWTSKGIDALQDMTEPALHSLRHLDQRVHIGEELWAVSDIVHWTRLLQEPALGGRVAAFDPLVEYVLHQVRRSAMDDQSGQVT
jgi:hypothetical protein